MDPNMSLWSNGVDWTRSLWKFLIWFRLHEIVRYIYWKKTFRTVGCAVKKWSKTHWNTCVGSNGVHSTRSSWKFSIWIRPHDLVHFMHYRDWFCSGVCAVKKWSETHPNMSLESNQVDCTHSLRENPIWIRPNDMAHYIHYGYRFCTGVCVVTK